MGINDLRRKSPLLAFSGSVLAIFSRPPSIGGISQRHLPPRFYYYWDSGGFRAGFAQFLEC